ncbi:MAG: hypothetical protein LBS42_04955 [Tannerella sp.]|jgi:hypothetical protein|nr:hypothetical protein [Tannerella sp.]
MKNVIYNQIECIRTAAKVLLFVIFIWTSTVATAFAQDITDKFTDEIFKAYVASNFGDFVVPIEVGEVALVIDLDVRNSGIKSLNGIENFTALEEINCSKNQLTELDVRSNTALKYLYCETNQLTKLDLSENHSLEELNCSNNQLTELDVSNNTALMYLYCSNNQLTELDVSNKADLQHLNCNNNRLLAGKLNITGHKNGIGVTCKGNYLPEPIMPDGKTILGYGPSSTAMVSYNPQKEAPEQPPLQGGTLPPLIGDDTYNFGEREEWYDHLDRVPFDFKPLTSDYMAWLFKDEDDDRTTSSPFVITGMEENADGDGFVVFVRVKPDLPLGVHTDTLIVWAVGDIVSKTPLVFTVQAAKPIPSMPRRIVIPGVEGAKTNPSAGVHYVASGQDFIFTFIPTDTLLFYDAPIVRTGRLNQSGDEDVVVTSNTDGTYTVRIRFVRQALTLTIEAPPPAAPPAGMAAPALPSIWSYGGQLYVSASSSGEARIYNPVGVLVKSLPYVSGKTVRTPLPQGFYLVVAEEKTYKVSVNK